MGDLVLAPAAAGAPERRDLGAPRHEATEVFLDRERCELPLGRPACKRRRPGRVLLVCLRVVVPARVSLLAVALVLRGSYAAGWGSGAMRRRSECRVGPAEVAAAKPQALGNMCTPSPSSLSRWPWPAPASG